VRVDLEELGVCKASVTALCEGKDLERTRASPALVWKSLRKASDMLKAGLVLVKLLVRAVRRNDDVGYWRVQKGWIVVYMDVGGPRGYVILRLPHAVRSGFIEPRLTAAAMQ
jgi:hypothetical protein